MGFIWYMSVRAYFVITELRRVNTICGRYWNRGDTHLIISLLSLQTKTKVWIVRHHSTQ